jgi:hypothetical protein
MLLLLCGILLMCVGCEKGTGDAGADTQFEIDKEYERGPLTAHVRVDKSSMTIAQTCLLELQATIKGTYQVQMPSVNEVLQHFGIVDWHNVGDRLDANDNVVRTYRYRLEPFLSGEYELPSFNFVFNDVNDPNKTYVLETDPIEIKVTSLLGEDREKLVIADIEDVVEVRSEASLTWIWITAGVVIVVVAGGWFFMRSKRGVSLIRIFKPAHEIAYERLRKLVARDLIKAEQIKQFYEEISNILRHYIEDRFDLRAPERTTEEFLIELQSSDALGESDKKDLGEFLGHCDLVKFAKHRPETEQIQRTFDLVKNFIEKTNSDDRKVDVTDEVTVSETVEVGSS